MTAVDRTWVGGTTDFENDWGTATNWSPEGVPDADDTAFIVSGSVDIDGETETAVTRIVVGPKYTGSIGSSDTKLDIDATDLDYGGRGAGAYFLGTYTTVTVQDTGTGTTALNFYGSTDTITTLRIVGGRGSINIDASCNMLTTIEQIGADGVTTTLADGTTVNASCALTMDSGTFNMNEAIPTVTVFGGELESAISSTDTIGLLETYGGRVRFNPTGACTIDQLTLYSGDFSTSDSLAPTFTITDCILHGGAKLNERSGLQNAVFTNAIQVEGGKIEYDIGRVVTIT